MDKYKKQYLLEQVNRLKTKNYEIGFLAPLMMDEDLSFVMPYTQFDDLRIKEISGELGCSFEIVKVSDIENIYSEIKRLKKVILQKVNELKKQNHFVDWNPVSHSIEQVQRAYPNAIFFQATGQIDNNGYDPIRGPIKIDESKRSNADLFVTYSGGTYPTIISVCCINENTWNAFDPDPNRGFYQTGNEIVNHPLISSGMTQWNIKSNRYYGDNLKKT
jgi:hypothetical protein